MARHFVSLLRDKRPLAARLGTPQAEIRIKFVSVFDTVSSQNTSLVVGNDVSSLGLALGNTPKRIVHLTAGNEYRQNFSLTNIGTSFCQREWWQGGSPEAFPSAAAFERYYGDTDRSTMVKEIQHELPGAVQHAIATHSISTKKWGNYLATYPWQVAFNVPFALDQRYTIHYAIAEYSNFPLP